MGTGDEAARGAPSESALDVAFARERAETIRTRLRWIFPAAAVVLIVSFVSVDRAAFSLVEAARIRAPELLVTLVALWWLRRPRSRVAIEVMAVAVWAVVAAAAAYGFTVVPAGVLPTKVASHVLSALVVCVIAGLGWRATAAYALLTVAAVHALKLRSADELLTLTLTTSGFAYGVVIASAAARERSQRAELAARLALLAANERLARDDELRRRLFVNLSHDLRTPLAVVRGEAALLRSSGRFPGDDAALHRVESNARALADLADQLLDLARLESGQMPLRPAKHDVGRIAEDVAALLESPSHRSIAVTVAAPRPVALVDRGHAHRILANLVANARRHAPDDVALSVREEGGRVVVDVSDGGAGVPPSRREAIFQRFVSFDSDGTTAAGIGVPLARELATLNAGSLELLDAERTTFRLTLPRADGPADDTAPDADVPVAPWRDEPSGIEAPGPYAPTLLVIEDHADLAALLGRVLGARFRVDHVARVADALGHLAAHVPDAVLCDVLLPDGTGYEVLAKVRGDRELERVPVVLVSALGSVDERVRGLSAGADDYVTKPFAPEELLSRVETVVRRAEARRRALELQREGLLMEIHDGVSASLARASMLLAAPDGAQANVSIESLAFAREALRDGLDEVRAITRLLAPRDVDWVALTAEIRRSMGDACAAAQLRLDFAVDGEAQERTVPAAVAHTLRRLAREATTNAIKHARARTLTCRMTTTAACFALSVEDDGVGLEHAPGEGRGLGIMRRRVGRVGGELEIGTGRHGGTRVLARLVRAG